MQREPGVREAVFAELATARGAHALLDAEVTALGRVLDADPASLESQARWLAERLALALQASILLRGAPAPIADAFCASRLGGAHGLAFGTLRDDAAVALLLARAWPQ